jgi:DNA polymerase-3 subunit delta
MPDAEAVEKPIVYLVHGEDTLAMRAFVAGLRERMGEPGMAELNTQQLDASVIGDEQLRAAVNTLPFLTERRLVIVERPLARLNTAAARQRFLTLLEGLPLTTALVLLLPDEADPRRGWKNFGEDHWLMKWAAGQGGRVLLRSFRLPTAGQMPAWLQQQAKKMGLLITPLAAEELANLIGEDTERASRELEKLAAYVNAARPIEVEDVQELVAQAGEVDVFGMVDALGEGDTRRALRLLQGLLQVQDPFQIFGMVVRQFRLLLQVREQLDEGRLGDELSGMKSAPRGVMNHLARQAQRFSMDDLSRIYHELLDLDEQMKNGDVDPVTALDRFVAGLS